MVLVIGPAKDTLSKLALDCSGALHETTAYKSPAYSHIPPSPLHSNVLPKFVGGPPALPVEEVGQPPRECIETWAGGAQLTAALVRLGFTGRAYECSPDNTPYLPEGDMLRSENQKEVHHKIKTRSIFNLHEGITCTSWTLMQNMNSCTRTLDLPQGDGTLEHEVSGNKQMAVALFLLWECFR